MISGWSKPPCLANSSAPCLSGARVFHFSGFICHASHVKFDLESALEMPANCLPDGPRRFVRGDLGLVEFQVHLAVQGRLPPNSVLLLL